MFRLQFEPISSSAYRILTLTQPIVFFIKIKIKFLIFHVTRVLQQLPHLRDSRGPVDAVGLVILLRGLLAGTYGVRFAILIAVRWYYSGDGLWFWFVIDWWKFLFGREEAFLDTSRRNPCVVRTAIRMHERFLDENAMRATKCITIWVARCESFALQMSMPTMHVRCDFVEAHRYLTASIFPIILRASRRFIILRLTDRDKAWQCKKSVYFYGEDSIRISIVINDCTHF